MKLDLWATVSFHRDLDLMVWQPRGMLDEEVVDRLVEMLEEAEDETDTPFDRYTDLSKLDVVAVNFDYVFRLSLYRCAVCADRPPVKSAFYVTDRSTAEIALTHAVVAADTPLIVQVFLDKSAAAEWLDVSIDDLELDR
jgi:hypothetical protein